MYKEWQQYFTSLYGPIPNWPKPHIYYCYYHSQQTPSLYLSPQLYNQLYEYTRNEFVSTPAKPSRNEKRKTKKQALQKELASEKQLIGDWVNLERRDLIEGLKAIEKQEEKIKEKKSKRLDHLIQIHKEVYKHMMKKGNKPAAKIRGKKKKLSMIKKMKRNYIDQVKKNKQQNAVSCQKQSQNKEQLEKIGQEDEYITDEEDQKVSITYNHVSKLTGTQHCSFFLREWVTNCPSQQLQDITLRLVNRLSYKQAIKKVNQPQKARKLIFSGVKEVKRTCKTIIDKKRALCVLIALNIERNHLKKGIDDQIQKVIALATLIKIPIIHVSTRAKLGRAFTGKFGPKVAVVSIVNCEGYQDYYEDMIQKWKIAIDKYQKL